MKFVDDYNKDTTWYNRNYFFLGTIAFAGIMVLMEYVLKEQVTNFMAKNAHFAMILSPMLFGNVMNLIVSAACVGLVSLFLEKYWGTIRYLVTMLLTLVLVAYMLPILTTTHMLVSMDTVMQTAGLQLSGLVYAVFALALAEIIFHPKKYLLDKLHSLPAYGVIIVIVAIMCVLLPDTYNNDMAAYFKEVKFTVFEPVTKNIEYWFSAIIGGSLGIVSSVATLVSGGAGFGGGYSSGGSKRKSKDDTGLTFADIMEKEKKEAEAVSAPATPAPTTYDSASQYVSTPPSAPMGGYGSGYNTTPTTPTQPASTGLNSIFGETTDNKDRVVVGETVKQYSDYNQYINEKMKNLNNKAGGNK